MTVPRSVPTIFAAALLLFGADRLLSQAEPEEVDTVTDEITVTAQRVEESVQDVPISIVTLSGEEIEQQAIRDVQGIADAAPGVVLGNQSSTTGEIAVTIRGIGSNTLGLGTESTVGYYVDGVYMPRPQSFASAFLDLERVEVLRGPQGTLWGRNSTGGALNLVTRSPEASFRGSVIGSLSDYDAPGGASDSRYGLSLTGPLTSKVLARISGVSASVEDATWNEHLQERADNLDGTTLRVGLTMLPTTGTTFTLRADQTDDDAHNNFQLRTGSFAAESLTGSLLPFFGHAEPIGPHRIAANIAPLSTYEESGLSLHIDHQTAGGLTLTSISSTRSLDSDRIADVDASPLDFVENHGTYGSDWWSQEVQLRGASDRTRWIAGAGFTFTGPAFPSKRWRGRKPYPANRSCPALPWN